MCSAVAERFLPKSGRHMADIYEKLHAELHSNLEAGRNEIELTLKKTFDVRPGFEETLIDILEWIQDAGQLTSYQVKKLE
jgi:hypothetical protein